MSIYHTVVKNYIHAPDVATAPLGLLNNGPSSEAEKHQYYFSSDLLGSTNYVTDLAGDIVQHTEYKPFGTPFVDQHRNNNEGYVWQSRYSFNGKEEDIETGLHYYGARYYDASVGRWMSVDPLADKYVNWSPYNYTLNNPIGNIDPDGRVVIAANEASKALVLKTVTFMFGVNHGYSFSNNVLVHDGKPLQNMTSGQLTMFKYFNEVLVKSKSITTVRANQSIGFMDIGSPDDPVLLNVSNAVAKTFSRKAFKKHAGSGSFKIPVYFSAENQILIPSNSVLNGSNVATVGGVVHIGADHVLAHEFGHSIMNMIMNEFGGNFNGINFNNLTKEERSDWSIKFTNSLFSGNSLETGEGQHGRNNNSKPTVPINSL